MKKRLLSALLVIAMLCALLPQTAIIASAGTYSGKCGNRVNWSFDSETGVLNITGTGKMDNYTYYNFSNRPWHYYRDFITSVVIENGITSIGDYAFYSCDGLTSVTIMNSVKSIGDYAFNYCTKFTSVTIPDSVTSIGDGAFNSCTGLTSITIPGSVTSIGGYAFQNSKGLTNVIIGNGVASIGSAAFEGCTGLTSVSIPDSVTSIDSYTFNVCTGLTNVIIGDGVTSIGDHAFGGCTGLTSITIPDSVNSIGEEAFYYSTGLSTITISDSVTSIGTCAFDYTAYYTDDSNWQNGVLYIDNCLIEAKNEVTSYEIKDGTRVIADVAFSLCTGLTSVTIPDGVSSIGKGAFSGCSGLKAFSVSNSNPNYSSNEYGVLFNKDKTKLFCFPGGIKEGTYIIPDGVTSIGDFAFSECRGLTSVTIPDSVTSIGGNAFYGCKALSDVYYGGSEKQWNAIEIGVDNDSLTDANIHYLNHNWSAPTYTWSDDNSSVTATRVCADDADHTETETVSAVAATDDATCETAGRTVYSASFNNPAFTAQSKTVDIPALGHDWGEWVYNNDATVEKDGTKTRVCKNDPTHTETVTAEGTKLAPPVEFKDVQPTAFYAESVKWAVANNVTNGTGEGTFSPGNKCTRGQVVTFLWRAAGSPEPKTKTNPFTDVKESGFYFKAVLWAVENGVTSGLTATTFGPGKECTRGQVVTFLWRAKGSPAPTKTTHPFTDVKADGFYFKAMLWAVENEVTNGTTATTFGPNKTCTRGQVVTFLYRAFK